MCELGPGYFLGEHLRLALGESAFIELKLGTSTPVGMKAAICRKNQSPSNHQVHPTGACSCQVE